MRRGGYIGQGWLVLLLALAFGAALAGVQVAWGPRIELNKENDARKQVPILVQGAVAELTGDGQDREVSDGKGTRVYRIYRAMEKAADGRPRQIGWVLKAKGPGYADNIELLIGLKEQDEALRITGLYVLAQNETPGLGNKIKGRKFRENFDNKTAGEALEVTREKGKAGPDNRFVEAISGATISSESVCGIVNRAVEDFSALLPSLKATASGSAEATE